MAGIDSYTVLMLHMNGSDGSTTFTDSSTDGADSPHTMSVNGNAQIDTAQSKFGGASGLFDGTGDYLTSTDSADWNFGTGDFTIDFWVRFNSTSGTQVFFGQGTNGDTYMRMEWNGSQITFNADSTIFTYGAKLVVSWSPSANTWYHISLIRGWGGSNSTFAIVVNGTSLGTGSDADTYPEYTGPFSVAEGHYGTGVLGTPLNGWLDEFRVSKGIARWTANFTPPTEEYSGGGGVILSSRMMLMGVS